MDDEFALCWNNFQDNIATGFQNLYDRGDLVDVTLACDGKLLQAHKIVLAICSPYFQEIFVSNPCKHPIIILNDVTYTVMSELLQFMYQGVVNVKHTDLTAFMKIAQALQIKGLTTSASSALHQRPSVPASPKLGHNSSALPGGAASSKADGASGADAAAAGASFHHPNMAANNVIDTKINSAAFGGAGGSGNSSNMMNAIKSAGHLMTSGGGNGPSDLSSSGQKRSMLEYGGGNEYNKRPSLSRGSDGFIGHGGGGGGVPSDHEMHGADSMENLSSDEGYMPPIPQISMLASDSSVGNISGSGRFDLNNVKRESLDSGLLSPVMRGLVPPPFFDYNSTGLFGGGNCSGLGGAGGSGLMASGASGSAGRAGSSASSVKNVEYPNELHMGGGEYGPGKAGTAGAVSVNHMDIPAGGQITMLSSTSLLHGNCIFNRNNTVATQQGMKTYWLCKSYRITMCRARCITHQGRVISATGVHNHQPHSKPLPTSSLSLPPAGPSSGAAASTSAGILGLAHHHHQTQQQQQQQQAIQSTPPSQSQLSAQQHQHHGSTMAQHQQQQLPSQHSQQQSATIGSSADFMSSLISNSGRSPHNLLGHIPAAPPPVMQPQQQPQQHQQHHQQHQQHLHSHHLQQHHQQLQQQQQQHSPDQQMLQHHGQPNQQGQQQQMQQQHHHHLQQQQQHQQQLQSVGNSNTTNAAALQNMVQNVLNQNSLMQLSNLAPILNQPSTAGHQHYQHHQLSHIHAPASLQITAIMNTNISPSHSPQQQHQQHGQQQQQQQQHHHSHQQLSQQHSTANTVQHHQPHHQQHQPQHHHHHQHQSSDSVELQSNSLTTITPNMSIVVTTTTHTTSQSSPDAEATKHGADESSPAATAIDAPPDADVQSPATTSQQSAIPSSSTSTSASGSATSSSSSASSSTAQPSSSTSATSSGEQVAIAGHLGDSTATTTRTQTETTDASSQQQIHQPCDVQELQQSASDARSVASSAPGAGASQSNIVSSMAMSTLSPQLQQQQHQFKMEH